MSDEQPIGLNVIGGPEVQAGVWANYARVNHSPYEFTLDFVRIDFAQPPMEGVATGVLVSRVAMSPLLITQLIDALTDNYSRYAQKAMPPEVREHEGRPDSDGPQRPDAAPET